MGYSKFDSAGLGRAAWNAGKTVGTKRPLTYFGSRQENLARERIFECSPSPQTFIKLCVGF